MMYQRIRDLRKGRNWSQQEVARLLHVARTTYSAYERGRLNIPIENIIQLTRLFHTSVDYLLGLTNDPAPYRRLP